MRTNRTRAFVTRILVAMLIVFVATVTGIAQKPVPDGVKFEVLSVKPLSDNEAASRSPDFVGPNIAVRLRLSTGERGISFYGWPNGVTPGGYKVQMSGNQTVWLFGTNSAQRSASPGINAVLFGSKGAWITLPPHSAVEWEELDSSQFAGKIHAYTAFVRVRPSEEIEMFSDRFTVPSKAGGATAPGLHDPSGRGPSGGPKP